MATVTGLTKEAMEAIRDGVIVDAEVVGNNLILTKFDASTIDAGDVRGPTGAGQPSVVTSLPGSPTDLDEVYYQTAAMATAKVMWHIKYFIAIDKWLVLGGNGLYVKENTSTTSLAVSSGVATAFSPAVNISLPAAGEYRIRFGAKLGHSGHNQGLGVVPIATGLAYSGSNQAIFTQPTGTSASDGSVAGMIQAAGISGTLELRYQAGASGGYANYKWLEASPITLG